MGNTTIKVKSIFEYLAYGPAPDAEMWNGSVEKGELSREKALTLNLVDKHLVKNPFKKIPEFWMNSVPTCLNIGKCF